MKKQQKQYTNEFIEEYSGITLISLVITIIILIILAGISINLILGENGLFNKAREAQAKFLNAQAEEETSIADLEKQIEEYSKGLPENTEDTEAGTEVKLPSKWSTTTPAYVETEKGDIVKKSVVASNVKAIATGNGEKVPVPIGFYYVGGTIESGVVISDNPNDQNKYAGTTDVPAGVEYDLTTGIPKTEDQLTDGEKQKVILGNQFVWIPVELEDYKKEVWTGDENTEYSNATWETQPHTSELIQIEKYGGFYIGRYEAGTSEISLSTKVDFANQNDAKTWQNPNFSIRDESGNTATGNITCKAGEIPYYHADYFTALILCNKMYESSKYVQSGLVTGTMWDAMMKFIAIGDDTTVTTNCTWGNYREENQNVKYTAGQGRYAIVDNQGSTTAGRMLSGFQKSDGQFHYGIRSTASTENVKQKNLYDVAGNLWEWTQEASYPNDLSNNIVESYMRRGGGFENYYNQSPACFRARTPATQTNTDLGYRPALYIK